MGMRHVKDNCAIAVFARAPIPGEAKTRLIPKLGAEGAAELHARLVEHTLETATRSRLGPVTLWCAGPLSHAFFERCSRRFNVPLKGQPNGDLGGRMLSVFQQRAGAATLVIGTDCPSMTVEHLQACKAALAEGEDAVFLPAEDGGYGLVGMTQPIPLIFQGMTWSTDDVMEETRLRLHALNLSWREPAIIWDVDRPEDVERLAASGLLKNGPMPLA